MTEYTLPEKVHRELDDMEDMVHDEPVMERMDIYSSPVDTLMEHGDD